MNSFLNVFSKGLLLFWVSTLVILMILFIIFIWIFPILMYIGLKHSPIEQTCWPAFLFYIAHLCWAIDWAVTYQENKENKEK